MEFDRTLFERVSALAVKHSLPMAIFAKNDPDLCGQDFTRWLFRVFPSCAVGHVMEQGEAPSDYYPRLFQAYAAVTQGEFVPAAVEFDSIDDWESMIIRFQLKGKSQKIVVKDVEDSDWFTPEFVVALNKFATKHLSGRWVDFDDGSDWCTSLYVPAFAYSDFLQLRESLKRGR